MDKKETKEQKKRKTSRQTNHTHLYNNNDDDSGVSRAVVVHRGERFGREILARGDRRKRRRLVV